MGIAKALRAPLYQRMRRDYDTAVKDAEARLESRAADALPQEADIPDPGRIDASEVARIRAKRTEETGISIIIPSKDHPELLERCIASIVRTTDLQKERLRAEILIVDNGSNTQNRKKTDEITNSVNTGSSGFTCRYLYQKEDFHFSRMCNRGAWQTSNELLLFLNDDTEAVTKGFLSLLAAFALQEQTGAVGAKLLYPQEEGEEALIQHCGIVNEYFGPVHKLLKRPDSGTYFWDYQHGVRHCIAVTGACLMIRASLFRECGGFPEVLPVAFNDVDLCYTLHEKGYRNICCNDVVLTHYESLSRGDDTLDADKMLRLSKEAMTLADRHPQIAGIDPFYDGRLSKGADIEIETRPVREASASGYAARSVKNASEYFAVYRYDPCVHVSIEYAGADGADFLIRGFAFVAGSDNALYEKELILQQVTEEDGVYRMSGDVLYVTEIIPQYRGDVSAKLTDQTNCALCGLEVRIKKEALPPALYRIGVATHLRYSKQRLFNWGIALLDGNGTGTSQ